MVLRRKGKNNNINNVKEIFKSENLKLDKGAHIVRKNDEEISITLNEYKLMLLLMENSPKCID
ncbi:hypothetical protein [Clostridium butyricum]|uniref:hypothetical protein n=1 Tax=Clostridium butyricum TaxID=1492 RepID=UPI000AFD691C|nr:hypothetical protein [Clostridium butyricum]